MMGPQLVQSTDNGGPPLRFSTAELPTHWSLACRHRRVQKGLFRLPHLLLFLSGEKMSEMIHVDTKQNAGKILQLGCSPKNWNISSVRLSFHRQLAVCSADAIRSVVNARSKSRFFWRKLFLGDKKRRTSN